jgi:hypothetical protein
MSAGSGRAPPHIYVNAHAGQNGPRGELLRFLIDHFVQQKPHLARLTLARKIAAITLLVWKKGVRFDAEHLKQQAA